MTAGVGGGSEVTAGVGCLEEEGSVGSAVLMSVQSHCNCKPPLCRYVCKNRFPHSLPKLLQSISWSNRSDVAQVGLT